MRAVFQACVFGVVLTAVAGASATPIAPDNREAGRTAARELGRLLGGHGGVLLLRYQINAEQAEAREEGFIEVITREFPGLTLVASDYHAGPTAESAGRVADGLLVRYQGKIDGVYASSASGTLGMRATLQRAGVAGARVRLIGSDEPGGELVTKKREVFAAPVGLPVSQQAKESRMIPGLDLVLLPLGPGQFSRDSGKVNLSRRYWLGNCEVTQRQWTVIMGTNPSDFIGDALPVDNINWLDAMEFCRRLTERERTAGRLPEGYVYTLPTEAQWEYAARAGQDEFPEQADEGWWATTSGAVQPGSGVWRMSTHPVGQKRANSRGFHDLAGNVAEWCLDWSADYSAGEVTDPTGGANGTYRVLRGGCWWADGQNCHFDSRHKAPPARHHSGLGLRLALSAPTLAS